MGKMTADLSPEGKKGFRMRFSQRSLDVIKTSTYKVIE